MNGKQYVIYWLLTGLFTLLSCFIFAPGSMGNDSLTQWYQVNDILPVTDWHPPVIYHLWSFFNQFIEGPISLLIFQQVLYWIGIALIIQSFLKKQSLLLQSTALIIIGFFPVSWFGMASVWKDALMLSSLLFAVGIFLLARERKNHIGLLIVSFLALILACSFRHNAILAVLPLSFFIGYLTLKPRSHFLKLAASLTLLFCIVFTSKFINEQGVVKPFPYLINQVVFWNLAGLSLDTDTILIPEEAFVNKDSAQVEVLKRYYTDASNNQLVFGSGIINPQIWKDEVLGKYFFITGIKTITQYPVHYCKMRLRFLKEFSGMGRWLPYLGFIFETNYWKDDEKLGLPMYHMHHPTILQFLQNKCAVFLTKIGFYNIIPYLLILVIAFASLSYSLIKQTLSSNSLILWWLLFSGLLYWLPYIVVAPSNDFRYHNWTIEVVLIFVVLKGLCFFQHILNRKGV